MKDLHESFEDTMASIAAVMRGACWGITNDLRCGMGPDIKDHWAGYGQLPSFPAIVNDRNGFERSPSAAGRSPTLACRWQRKSKYELSAGGHALCFGNRSSNSVNSYSTDWQEIEAPQLRKTSLQNASPIPVPRCAG